MSKLAYLIAPKGAVNYADLWRHVMKHRAAVFQGGGGCSTPLFFCMGQELLVVIILRVTMCCVPV